MDMVTKNLFSMRSFQATLIEYLVTSGVEFVEQCLLHFLLQPPLMEAALAFVELCVEVLFEIVANTLLL